MLMLQIVATMQVFLEPFLMTSGGPGGRTATVVYQIYQYAVPQQNIGYSAALGIMLLLVLAGFAARLPVAEQPRREGVGHGNRDPDPHPDLVACSWAVARGRVAYRIVLTVFIVGFAVIFLFPLYWMVTSGLKYTNEVIQSPPTFFPHSFVWSNFSNAWDELDLGTLIKNTALYARRARWCSSWSSTSRAAYALSKLRPALGNIVLFAMLTTLMIPATVIAVPAFLVALEHADHPRQPRPTRRGRSGCRRSPTDSASSCSSASSTRSRRSCIQAAAIDGAGPLRTMWSVVLPISRPVLAVISIFAVVNVWKDFLWPLLVLRDNTRHGQHRSRPAAERHPARDQQRRAGDRLGADDRLLPGLPAEHPGRPGRRCRSRTDRACDPPAPGSLRVPSCLSKGNPQCRRHRQTGRLDLSWWRHAAIYQVYVRSFADGNADGTGDIAGVRSRLQYLADLGVDAIWFNPWYPSPMADAGYDIADYRDIEPVFGTLPEAEALIAEAHALGIRVIIDIVPNHGSDEHAWFKAALAGGPGAPERDLFWFRPGKGESGELPPNDWNSIFGGPAWTRTTDPDGSPGEWYLHLFAPGQPDWNWDNPAGPRRVRGGAAVLAGPRCRRHPHRLRSPADQGRNARRLHRGRDRGPAPVHRPARGPRRLPRLAPADRQLSTGDRILIGEVWLPDRERFARYLAPDELHTAFNFDFLGAAWDADRMRAVIDGHPRRPRAGRLPRRPGCCPTTTSSGTSPGTAAATRRSRWTTGGSASSPTSSSAPGGPRAAALVTMALPGAVYVYQGEELGLNEVEDLPEELLQDPIWPRSGFTDKGRDGARVPIPWSGDAPPFGFNAAGVEPWLPQPAEWKALTVAAEDGDPGSMLELYRCGPALPACRSPSLASAEV